MNEFLRWLLGLKQAPDWVSGGSWQVQFHSWPQGPWAVALAVLAIGGVAVVWYLYRSEPSTVGRGMRWTLAALRCLVLVCAAFMLLELVLVITKRESPEKSAHVAASPRSSGRETRTVPASTA